MQIQILLNEGRVSDGDVVIGYHNPLVLRNQSESVLTSCAAELLYHLLRTTYVHDFLLAV